MWILFPALSRKLYSRYTVSQFGLRSWAQGQFLSCSCATSHWQNQKAWKVFHGLSYQCQFLSQWQISRGTYYLPVPKSLPLSWRTPSVWIWGHWIGFQVGPTWSFGHPPRSLENSRQSNQAILVVHGCWQTLQWTQDSSHVPFTSRCTSLSQYSVEYRISWKSSWTCQTLSRRNQACLAQ